MSNEEAYELLIKYLGGEKGVMMIREMIHHVGVDEAVENMIETYHDLKQKPTEEFKQWMKQAFEFMKNKMQQPLN